jgi:hypothetical protein
MDTQNVPPQAVVLEVASVLDAPEIQRLIETIDNYARWTGRPGYPVRAMVGCCIVKVRYELATWSRVVRLVAEHEGLQRVLGCVPSQWACYRFIRALGQRDRWALDRCVNDVLASLLKQYPNMGQVVAVDATDLPAYASGRSRDYWGNERKASDPDASWGYRSAVSTRLKGRFYGYKADAAVCVMTGLPIAFKPRSAGPPESDFVLDLLDTARQRGFKIGVAIMDKAYDKTPVHQGCIDWGIAPVIPIRETGPVRRGVADPPYCAHGEWIYAGADYKRKATKWRCPAGECSPASRWVKADRLHPLIPRSSKRYEALFRQRSAVEREFGRLKHEWALVPLRTRGLVQVQLHVDLTILVRLMCALVRTK